MTWIIKIPDGPEVESDDFTLDTLDKIEKYTGEYWSIQNPLRSVKVARAFLKAAYEIADMDPTEVDALTMKYLKSMFDYRADDDSGVASATPLEQKSRKGRTRKPLSDGAPTDSNGRPQLRASNE